MFFVYILTCSDGSFYVGHAQDIKRRLDDHNAARGAMFTFRRRPVRLAYAEAHETETSAVQRERQIKGWTRAKKEALIRGDLDRLRRLSRRGRG
jgi:putative endonuclease